MSGRAKFQASLGHHKQTSFWGKKWWWQILTFKVSSAISKPDAKNQDSKENQCYQDSGHDAPHIQLHCERQMRRQAP